MRVGSVAGALVTVRPSDYWFAKLQREVDG